jgi:hypothetical protein
MYMLKSPLKSLALRTLLLGAAAACMTSAHALQWVTPSSAASGGTDLNGTTVQVPLAGTLTFYGLYSDNSAGSESGLGLSVNFDGTKLTNVQITEEFTKCRIAPAQVQINGANSAVKFGWIDTSIRRTSGTPNGAVGWPDVANPTATDDCLAITPANTDTAAFAPSGLKLFKMTAQWVAGTTAGTTALITLDSGGNYSFANASPGFQTMSFTAQASGAAACNLDIDGNGTRQAFVDGILLTRGLLGVTGASLTNGVTIPAGAPRNTPALISPFIAANNYDVDGSGTQQAFVDGVILVRLMLGVADGTLLNGITLPAGATFTTAAAIRANVNAKCGTSF